MSKKEKCLNSRKAVSISLNNLWQVFFPSLPVKIFLQAQYTRGVLFLLKHPSEQKSFSFSF